MNSCVPNVFTKTDLLPSLAIQRRIFYSYLISNSRRAVPTKICGSDTSYMNDFSKYMYLYIAIGCLDDPSEIIQFCPYPNWSYALLQYIIKIYTIWKLPMYKINVVNKHYPPGTQRQTWSKGKLFSGWWELIQSWHFYFAHWNIQWYTFYWCSL